MAAFEVSEFFRAPLEIAKSNRRSIDIDLIKEFLKNPSDEFSKLLNAKGVYIFSMKAGKGRKPWYVGKAEKQLFGKESFNSRNLVALNKLINNRKGTLEISFITQIRSRGKPNLSQISEIEYLMIGAAAERNSDLLNKHFTKDDDFSIKNIYNSGKGRPTNTEIEFKSLMGF